MEKEKVERLRRKLKDEVDVHPTWPDLRNRLGLVFAVNGDNEKAVHEFREALRINPNYREALLNLGFSLLEIQNDQEAREIFEEAHMRFPQSVTRGSDVLGIALLSWKMGDGEESLQILREALEKTMRKEGNDEGDFEFLSLSLAFLYYQLGQEEETNRLLTKIKGFEPFIPKLYKRWNDTPSNTFSFSLNPGLTQFYRDLAELYAGEGDFRGARAIVEKGALVSGHLEEYHHDLGILYSREGEDEESIHNYKKAIEIDPNFGKAHASLAFAYGNLGKSELAIEEFKKAIAIHPSYPDLHYSLGLLYFDQGNFDLAILEFRHALQHNSNFHFARTSLAFCLFRKGDYDEALKEYGKLIDGGVSSSEIFIHVGTIHQVWKNLEESCHYFEKACEIDPDYAEAHYHMGEIALEMGDREKARNAFSKCLSLSEDPDLILKVEDALQKINSKTQISNSK